MLAQLQTTGTSKIADTLSGAFSGPLGNAKASVRSLVDEQISGAKASVQALIDEQTDQLIAKVEQRAAEAKSLAAKGILAHYLASGLGIGSVLLILYGAWSLISRTVDPGYAALGLGLGIVAVLVAGVVVATHRPPSSRPGKRQAEEDA